MSALATATVALLPQLSIGELAKILSAFVEVHASAPALFEQAAHVVRLKIGSGSISAAHAAQLCWAFTFHGTSDVDITHCLSAIIQVRPQFVELLSCSIAVSFYHSSTATR